MFVILILAFFEYPSSINISSDFRYNDSTPHLNQPPCGATESIEIVCLFIFLVKWIVQCWLVGWRRFIRQPWLVLYAFMVVFSFFDLFISLGFCFGVGQSSFGATLRIHRFFRPFFFLVPSSIMKKFIKAVMRTVIQISNVLVLLVLHIYVFAMIGMLIFPRPIFRNISNISSNDSSDYSYYDQNIVGHDDESDTMNNFSSYGNFSHREGRAYFNSVEDSLISLLVFLTTANNPDVMTKIYQYNRLSFLYFFLFLSIGLYLILNLLTAAVYSEFRGFIGQSMQSSFVRRRVAFRAAFAVLARNTGGRHASKYLVRQLLQKAKISLNQLPAMYTQLETVNIDSDYVSWENFRAIFDLISKENSKRYLPTDTQYYSRVKITELIQKLVRNKYFQYFSIGMTFIHVAVLTIEMEIDYVNVVSHSNSFLAYINFFYFFYYFYEQVIKIIGLGRRGYFLSPANIFEGIITLGILFTEIAILIGFGHPFRHKLHEPNSYSTLIRVMNLLIVFRLLRIIPQFQSISFVFGTIIEILKNLRAFAGIIIVIYYLFALLGMAIFGENYKLENDNSSMAHKCGSYENLEYYSYNFHDFGAALVILWNIMVVNNWYVFLDAFSRATSKWAQLYFIAWWLVAVIITINLFISLVIEVFITRWEAHHGSRKKAERSIDNVHNRVSVASDPLFSTQSVESYASLVGVSDIRVLLQKNLSEPSESDLQHELHRHRDLL